jgi:hypothetical protein
MPVLCFRVEQKDGRLFFIQTDKLGNQKACFKITSTFEVNVEYSLKIRNLFLFKHEVSRIFTIPRNYKIGNANIDVFKALLMVMQREDEERMGFLYKSGEEISVSI